jgi:hypothetical protein
MRLHSVVAARTEAVPLSGTADFGTPCDDRTARTLSVLEDVRAVIQRPSPSVMSADRRRASEWMSAFEPRARPFIDPLAAWNGKTDTFSQVRMRSQTAQAAITTPFVMRRPTRSVNRRTAVAVTRAP